MFEIYSMKQACDIELAFTINSGKPHNIIMSTFLEYFEDIK